VKDISEPLRKAYFDLLNNISVDGVNVPVYDFKAPYPAKVPYIIIGEVGQMASNTKQTFGNEVLIDLLVYTAYEGDFGGRIQAERISNKVLELSIPTPSKTGLTQPSGLNITRATLGGNNDEFFQNDTKSTYRKRITIEHTIWQE
jgi:hypothetical protein